VSNTDLLSSDAANATATSSDSQGGANGTAPRKRAGLSGMVLAELRELAGQLGLSGTAGMRKGDLIAAIKERQASGSPRANGRTAPSKGGQTELPVAAAATPVTEPVRQEAREGRDNRAEARPARDDRADRGDRGESDTRDNARENTRALSAGANFLLRKPLNVESIAVHITIAKELMARERRRYFRYAVNLPVVLKEGEAEQHARVTNLSEAGMAVRTAKALRHSSIIDFAFDLSSGASVSGKGQVAWINTEGMAGIVLQTFDENGREHLRNRAESHQAHGLSGQLAVRILQAGIELPAAALPGCTVKEGQPPETRQHQQQRHFGYGAGIGSGHVADPDLARLRGVQVDGVYADANLLNQTETGGARYVVCAQRS